MDVHPLARCLALGHCEITGAEDGDRTHDLSLTKGVRYHCATSAIIGAGKETRTLDIFLGKEVLYQLSYTRNILRRLQAFETICGITGRKSLRLHKRNHIACAFDVANGL